MGSASPVRKRRLERMRPPRSIAQQPLSVSTDRISFAAIRCARILSEVARREGAVDRSGSGKVVEVYTAAALRQWGLDFRGLRREQD